VAEVVVIRAPVGEQLGVGRRDVLQLDPDSRKDIGLASRPICVGSGGSDRGAADADSRTELEFSPFGD
jgi:hypothetical protein